MGRTERRRSRMKKISGKLYPYGEFLEETSTVVSELKMWKQFLRRMGRFNLRTQLRLWITAMKISQTFKNCCKFYLSCRFLKAPQNAQTPAWSESKHIFEIRLKRWFATYFLLSCQWIYWHRTKYRLRDKTGLGCTTLKTSRKVVLDNPSVCLSVCLSVSLSDCLSCLLYTSPSPRD